MSGDNRARAALEAPAGSESQLSRQNAVPAVTTAASGALTLTVAKDGNSVDYVLEVSNLANLKVARLRQGKASATGDG